MRIGIDLGGTTVKAALCTEDGTLLCKDSLPTRTGNAAGLKADMKTLALSLCRAHSCAVEDVTAIGIGVPGSFDKKTCTLQFGTNLGLNNVSFADAFLPEFGCPVHLDNDANCAALGEATAGAAKGTRNMLMVTLGTGVGGGLIFNGKPITGKSYITGEFGHMRLPVDALTMMGLDFPLRRCGCGQHGCIENYLSGRGFAWLYQHYYHQPLQAPEIIALYDQGDEQARAHVERYLDLLAVCLGNILTIVDPDLVVIGGGLSNFPAITTQLADRLPRHLLPVARVPRIERARHGDAGGMRGAAFLHLTD